MKTIRLFLGLSFLISSSVALFAQNSTVTLIPTGAVWKYFDSGTDPGQYWYDLAWLSGFDDSTWPSGPAQLGYGDGDEATVVGSGTNQSIRAITTYFRHTFDLSDPSIEYSNVVLRVLRDDGVIVYLNGGEIFRNNMPLGPVTHQTLATATVNAPDESAFLTVPVPAGYLYYGPNTLAAEIHQVNSASTDISFDAELIANAGPIGPPQPIVVTARPGDIALQERGGGGVPVPGFFVISSSSALSHPFTVYFNLGGTVSNGVDYLFTTNQVVFSAGATQATVWITPVQDNLVEGTETVTLQVLSPPCVTQSPPPPGCYAVGSQSGGTVYIADAPPPNSPPSVHLNSPASGASFTAPAGIIISASAYDSNGVVSSVEFFQNGLSLGVRSNVAANPFSTSIFWSNVAAGSYMLTARARDNTGLLSTSAPVQISVTDFPPGPPRSILVSTGAVWKYLDDGSDPGPSWVEPNFPPFSFFDDAHWNSGPAQLGYGDGDEATVVRPGTNQSVRAITTYFRRSFELSDSSVIYSNLMLRVLRDDGVIVYLNGAEIFRNNMPAGPVNYLTLASAQPANENEYLSVPVPNGYLYWGPNLLAAEIHQVSVNSGDISFDAELTADGPDQNRPVVTLHVTDSWGREPGVLTVVEHAQFAVRRTGPTTNALTVSLVVGGTASNGLDYAFVSNRVTIPIGATQALVNIAPLMDNLSEPTETVELAVVPPVCAAVMPPPPGCYLVGSPASGTVTILNQPTPTNSPPTITLHAPTNGSVFTAGANVAITATAGNSDGTIARVDFLANGQVIGTYPDPLNFNAITFNWLNVSNGSYAIAARAWDEQGLSALSATANIYVIAPSNPPPPTGEVLIRFDPPSLPRGSKAISNWTESGFYFSTPYRMAHTDTGLNNSPDSGSAHLTFSHNQKPLTFHNVSGRLFSLLSMDLAEYSTVFPVPKDITVTGYKADNSSVSVVVRIDGVIDGPGGLADFETFNFGPEFSQLDRVEVFPETYSLDNVRVLVGDVPTNNVPPRTIVNVIAVDPVGGEPPHGAGNGKFSIRRSGDLSVNLNVLFTIGGSASNGVDYQTISNEVVIPAGVTETFIDIVPLADSLIELSESVVLTLQTPVCIAIAPPPPECYLLGVSTSAVVSIMNSPPTNSVAPVVSLFSPIHGSTFPHGATVFLGASITGTSMVQFVQFYRSGVLIGTSSSPASSSGREWTCFWSNALAGPHVLRAVATDVYGARGTSAPVSIVVGSNSVPPLTPIVFLYASDPAAAETGGLAPANPGRFTFMRYGATNGALEVCFEILGNASNSLDYLIATNCVVIPAGASNAIVNVEPIDDLTPEPTEVVVLRLLPSGSYLMGAPSTATVLIADNDSSSPTNHPPFPRLTVLPQGSDEMTTNGCRLILEGDGPVTCVIECSIDMLNWTPIYTNTLFGTPISIVDADANSPRRFYRLVTQ